MSEFVMKHNQTFPKQRIAYANCESILFSILYLVGLISCSRITKEEKKKKRQTIFLFSYGNTPLFYCQIVV